jgi:phage terminase large subunit-like protein
VSAIAPVQALLHAAPDFFETLTPEEHAVILYLHDLWLRPDQRIPPGSWSYYGFICGRGFGKTLGIACEINRRVECGEARHVGLMAPTEPRVDEVQVSNLIATAPPWFRPERYRDGLVWPNGVEAEVHTPEAPGRSRSSNFDLTWLTEIVDWQATTRWEAFKNITTATRVGSRPQVIWDTTSKGKNDVIQHLEKLHLEDPGAYPIQRGAMFDNPLLSREYLRTECRKYTGREYEEEIEGKVFGEAGGAVFHQTWIDDNRRLVRPERSPLCLVSIDPALSSRSDADETGLVVGETDAAGDAYVTEDLSGHHKPEEWGDLAIDRCARGAAGCVVERNHLGDNAVFVLRSRATTRGLKVEELPLKDPKPFPARKPGVVFVREVIAASSKGSRAGGPASETEAGRVHMVGRFAQLEGELTTYEPGTGAKSPNRFDAFVYLVIELRNLARGSRNTGAAVKDAAALAQELRLRLAVRPRRGL